MTEIRPADYAETLDALTRRVHEARFTLQRRANAELLALYWHIGRAILVKQESSGWGSGEVARLGMDLQAAFPTMRGLSRSNLRSMQAFAAAWPERNGIVHQPVGQLPWTHVVELLNALEDQPLREWYAGKDVQHTWSRADLAHHLGTRLHERDAAAPRDFRAALTRLDSELAHQISRDEFTLGFLGVDSDLTERALEHVLTSRIVATLGRLGGGFGLIGTPPRIEADGGDLSVDLLFFQVEQLRYAVIHLTTGTFDPGDAERLPAAVALADARMRLRDRHAPSVGILVAADGNESVVRYSVAGLPQPAALSRHELPPAEQAAFPEEETLVGWAAEVLGCAAREEEARGGSGPGTR